MKVNGNKLYWFVMGLVECESCKGTGLYNGFAEKDGARVVCTYCEGSGKKEIKIRYTKFIKRKKDDGATRVYTTGMGYGITDKNITVKGKSFPFADYGCSYDDWLNGRKPKPLEFLGCPYQETRQGLQSNDVNNLYKTRCEENLGFGLISNCKLHNEKATCWKIYKETP